MRKALKTLATLLLAATIGCHSVQHGRVTGKDIQPAFFSTTYVMSGKIMIPITQYHPPEYIVYIAGLDDRGKWRKDSVDVNENDFPNVHVGDHYDCNKTCQITK